MVETKPSISPEVTELKKFTDKLKGQAPNKKRYQVKKTRIKTQGP